MLLSTILAGAAAVYTAPAPPRNDQWYAGVFSFPESQLSEDEVSQVLVELTVDPGGASLSCRSRAISGNPQLGAFACRQINGRARFSPAKAPDGSRMYGVYRTYFSMSAGNTPPTRRPADRAFEIALTVPVPKPSLFIQFAVDAGGTLIPASCSLVPATGVGSQRMKQTVEPVFVSQVCAAIPAKLKLEPATDSMGTPVPSVQNAYLTVVSSHHP